MTISKEDINNVYIQLRDRHRNPKGSFDKAGRFYALHSEHMNVRSPTRSRPYSQMKAARTLKFVKSLAESCESLEELRAMAFD